MTWLFFPESTKEIFFRQIKQWKKSPDYLKIGRQKIFGGNEEAKDFVLRIVNQRFIDCDPIVYQEILEQLYQKYSLCIRKNSLYKYISRNSKLRSVIRIPMESDGVISQN